MRSNSISGIYIILNTRNGKVYIGQAVDFRARWSKHRSDLIHNRHNNRHLQSAWNKYGAKAFKFQKLEYCTVAQLDEREQHYLDVYITKGMCYNLAGSVQSMRGRKHSAETRQKISAALTNPSEETRRKRREAVRNISEESRRKMSEPNKGKIVTEETRRRMSESHKGHVVSQETRQKMREAKKNVSKETRRKLSEANKNHKIKAAGDQPAAGGRDGN